MSTEGVLFSSETKREGEEEEGEGVVSVLVLMLMLVMGRLKRVVRKGTSCRVNETLAIHLEVAFHKFLSLTA